MTDTENHNMFPIPFNASLCLRSTSQIAELTNICMDSMSNHISVVKALMKSHNLVHFNCSSFTIITAAFSKYGSEKSTYLNRSANIPKSPTAPSNS